MTIKINQDNRVRVQLTEFGKRTIKTFYGALGLPPSHQPVGITGPVLVYDLLEVQLWELFNIFGHCFFKSATEMPFVDNEIELL